MKNTLIYLIISSLVTGCVAGHVDTRYSFSGSDREVIIIDEFPVSVAIIQLDEFTFDVSSNESGFATGSRVNQPLVQRDRYRRAAISVLKKRLGESKQLSIIDEVFIVAGLFVRFKVTDKK
jgi:hypothetical protein